MPQHGSRGIREFEMQARFEGLTTKSQRWLKVSCPSAFVKGGEYQSGKFDIHSDLQSFPWDIAMCCRCFQLAFPDLAQQTIYKLVNNGEESTLRACFERLRKHEFNRKHGLNLPSPPSLQESASSSDSEAASCNALAAVTDALKEFKFPFGKWGSVATDSSDDER
jgi:hypothetical protein